MSVSRNRNVVARWACVAALAVAGVALAEEGAQPSTQPAAAERGGATTRPWLGRAAKRAEVAGPTEEEWRGVVEFMGKYSPNRMKAIEEQGAADGPRFAMLRKFVWGHYKELMGYKERGDQELYDLKLSLVQADDEVWGLQRKLREAPETDRPVVRHQLRQKTTDMVKLGLKEREIRIARLEKALAEEKEKLAADEKSVDQRVEERMKALRGGPAAGRAERKRDEAAGGDRAPATGAVGSEVK